MLNDLPYELLIIIINYACVKPSEYLSLRNTNQTLYNIISYLDNLYENDKCSYIDDMNIICKKNTTVSTFQWIFRNKINLSLENIKGLIMNNRYDIFIDGLTYEHFLKIIFNRFYMYVEQDNDIFTLTDTKNPLILAGIYNRKEIIKILLQGKPGIPNPYIDIIPSLFNISIKYSHKNILSYLIINFYENISCLIQNKLNTIINRISNCEDLLFYLMTNKKIILKQKHLISIISKHYNDLFIQYYSNNKLKFYELLHECISSNNIILFNHIAEVNKGNIDISRFTHEIIQGKKISTDLLQNIINNYLFSIERTKPFVKVCIDKGIDYSIISMLIEKGYIFEKEDMVTVLKQGDYHLLEVMCTRMLSKSILTNP